MLTFYNLIISLSPQNPIGQIVSYIAKVAVSCYSVGATESITHILGKDCHEKQSAYPIQPQTIYALKGL